MDFWEHRAVQDKCDLEDLKTGRVRDDETPPEEMDRSRLSPRRMAALKAFHSGSSLKDAAKAAGVTRQTLHRWRTIYHRFAEAMDVWEEGQMIIARSRLVDMADNAVDALANTIADGNARAAMMVLRSLQILRTYAPLKPPAEGASREPRLPGVALPRDSGAVEPPACRDRAGVGTGEQAKEGGETGWKPVVREVKQASGAPAAPPLSPPAAASEQVGNAAASDRNVAREQHAPGKTAPAAQHIHVIFNPPVERPKTARLAGKAGLAIKNACDIALQEVTESYEMLHANLRMNEGDGSCFLTVTGAA